VRGIRTLSILLIGIACLAGPRTAFPGDPRSVEQHARTIKKFEKECFEQSKRETAMRALAKINSLPAARVLASLLADPFVHIQELALQLLGGMKNPEVAAFLAKKCLFTGHPEVRRNAALALGLSGQKAVLEPLARALGDRDPKVGQAAARALAAIADPEAAAAIQKRLSSLRGKVKGEALRTLGKLDRLPDVAKLETFFKDSHWAVRVGVLDGLAAAKSSPAQSLARKGLADKTHPVKIAAVEALVAGAQGGEEENVKPALQGIESALSDKDWRVRAAAIHATVDLWNRGCIPLLIEAFRREQEGDGGRLIIDFGRILQLYTGKQIGFDADLWNAWWLAQKDKFQLGKKSSRDRYGVVKDLVDPPKSEKTEVTFYSLPVLSKRVAFVFDFSGSMKYKATDSDDAKPKIELARAKTRETLEKFKRDQWFNLIIYRYYSGFPPETKTERAFPAKLMPADPPRKAKAIEFLENQKPLGWGNFYEGILAAMDIPEVDTIYFLSDGKPSRGRYITKTGIFANLRVANRFRRVMIHTVLTGKKGADERFMRDLAALTWGMSTKG
jgi:HEAT repeat protein